MEKKYELSEETLEIDGHVLHRIIALKDFNIVKKGDLGGFVEKESNLVQDGDCWVYDDAAVYDGAVIYDDAIIWDKARIFDYAVVRDNAKINDSAEICDKSIVCGNAEIKRNAIIRNNKSDYIIFKNWWSSGRFFTRTKSNDMWSVGCFYGTGEELVKKAYNDSEEKGHEYEKVVKYIESIKSKLE